MVNIEKLPNEILVKIFTFFSVRDLGRCSRVSHRFRTISRDDSMWQKINLYGKKVPVEFVEQIFALGTKYLSLQETKLYGFFELPKKSELKYLNLSHCSAQCGI